MTTATPRSLTLDATQVTRTAAQLIRRMAGDPHSEHSSAGQSPPAPAEPVTRRASHRPSQHPISQSPTSRSTRRSAIRLGPQVECPQRGLSGLRRFSPGLEAPLGQPHDAMRPLRNRFIMGDHDDS